MSIAAIVLALVVAALGSTAARRARRQLAAARAQIEALQEKLAEAQRSPGVEELAREEPNPSAPAASLTAPSEPPAAEHPAPEVSERAAKMLREAQLMARHLGFEREVVVAGQKGIRVPVELRDHLDERAFEHLSATAEAVLEAGESEGDHHLVLTA